MSAPRERSRDDGGFSLVEVLVAMALLLLVTTTIYRVFGSSTKQVTALQGMIEEQSQARLALSTMQSELRNAFSGDETVPHIISMSATNLKFTSADRSTPLHLRRITYDLTGGVVTRAMDTSTNTYTASPMTWTWPSATPSRSVVVGVRNTIMFVYKDGNGAVTNVPANVRLIEITLQVKETKAAASQNAETYSTSVRMRGTG